MLCTHLDEKTLYGIVKMFFLFAFFFAVRAHFNVSANDEARLQGGLSEELAFVLYKRMLCFLYAPKLIS